MCLNYRFVIVVVSTSSVVWSQVRQFFLLEYIFVLLTMMNKRITLVFFDVYSSYVQWYAIQWDCTIVQCLQ